MGYSDEEILKARKKMEQIEAQRHSKETVEEEIKQSIYDEMVKIYDIPVAFKEREILDGRATIYLPEDFVSRSQEEIEAVYFLGKPPQYVFSNDYLYFMTSLNWTNNLIPNGQIPDFAKFAKQAIDRVGPKSRIMNEKKLIREEGNLAIIEFLANTIESVNYNVMFLSSVEERLLIGSTTFEQKYTERLLPIASEMAMSLKVIREEEVS